MCDVVARVELFGSECAEWACFVCVCDWVRHFVVVYGVGLVWFGLFMEGVRGGWVRREVRRVILALHV